LWEFGLACIHAICDFLTNRYPNGNNPPLGTILGTGLGPNWTRLLPPFLRLALWKVLVLRSHKDPFSLLVAVPDDSVSLRVFSHQSADANAHMRISCESMASIGEEDFMAFDPDISKTTRWKKGQPSPNPGGRPKSRLLSEALRNRLAEVKPDDPAGRTYAEAIAENLVRIACSGGPSAVHAANEIADRIEGRCRALWDKHQSQRRLCVGTMRYRDAFTSDMAEAHGKVVGLALNGAQAERKVS
jgi:hypothetical protein